MDKFNIYEYLSFVLPGGIILAAVAYGFEIVSLSVDPSSSGLVLLTAAAFVVGHLNTALANLLEPLAWGDRPGIRVSSVAGLFGRRGLYDTEAQKQIERIFADLYPEGFNFQQRFNIAYTVLRQKQLDVAIQTMNQQIGFYRNMATATLVCVFVIVGAAAAGHDSLDWRLFLPLGLSSLGMFVARYRRFWVRFGNEVVRGVQALTVRRNQDEVD